MTKERLKFIHDMSEVLAKAYGKTSFWETTKAQYLKLESDEEKNNVLGHIFADTKKEA